MDNTDTSTTTTMTEDALANAAANALTDEVTEVIDETVAETTSSSSSQGEAFPWPQGKKLNIVAHNVAGQNLFLTHRAANGQEYTLFHGAKKNGKGNCAIMFRADEQQNSLLPIPADFE